MFNTIKSKVDLIEQIVKDTGLEFKASGENTLSIENDEENGCPECGHHGCFKVKYSPETPLENMFKCFSCDIAGSVIDWVAIRNKISPVDAAYKIAKDNKIDLPKDFSPVQEIFQTAANYYRTCYLETCNKPNPKLARLTPSKYQEEVRKHSAGVLEFFNVGYSDGGLVDFLEGLGYSEELLIESGLKNKKTGRDFLPKDVFIYPHYLKGKVSHFTFKDSAKKLAYQLPNKNVLNGVEFYNQDSARNAETIIVVEGENDTISTVDAGGSKYGVIGTIGQISGDQLAWMRQNLAGKNVITIFDPDDAGVKYREKVEKLRSEFKSLIHILPPDEKDIDDLLTTGHTLEDILSKHQVQVKAAKPSYTPPKVLAGPSLGTNEADQPTSEIESDGDVPKGNVFEKFGCYHTVKYVKEEPQFKKLSNFTMQLKNILVTEDGDRVREITITRQDGFVSEPIRINSEAKVSLKSFRIFLARAADADFYGTEAELIGVWDLVYSKAPEVLIKVTRVVGRSEVHKGWIFANKYITDKGDEVAPDESGVFWIDGKKVGICPESLNKNIGGDNSNRDIPTMCTDLSLEDTEELTKGFIENLALNLGDPGTALVMCAWFNAVAYSNILFKLNKGYPMIFVNGSNGQGKGTICGWLMDLYNMADKGKTTVAQLKSGVGFGRKAEYYASLPLFIDEIRADNETKEFQNTFRSYYDRDGRTMGTKEGFGVRTQEVRACFMFAGEDHFEDPATKERCITVRIKSTNREKLKSFLWIESRKDELSAIGLQWIKESVTVNPEDLRTQIKALDRALVTEAGCSSRKSKNWAVVGHFAMQLAAKYMPDFDMKAFLFKASLDDSVLQKSETTVSQFFESIEGILSQEGIPKITNNHIMREGNELYIWYPYVFRIVQEVNRGMTFSKNAVLNAIKEEPYFIRDTQKIQMGLDGVRRVVITLDISKAPNSIQNIALGNNK